MWDSTQQTIKENYSIQIVKIISANILWTEKQPPHLYRQRTKHADFVCVLVLFVKKTSGWNAWRDQGYIQINMVLSNWTPDKNSAIQ